MAPARSGELCRRSPSGADWSSASVVLHVAVFVLLKVSLPQITPLSFPIAPSSFLFSTSTIAMDISVSLASFASPTSFLVDLRPEAMDSPIQGVELVDLRGELPFLVPVAHSAFLHSTSPITTAVSVSPFHFPLHELIFIPELVGALVSCPRMTPTVALPEFHHFSTTGSWIPSPQIHRRPPTKLSKRSMSCDAEDPGLERAPLWTPHVILLAFLEPRTCLCVQHASSEYGGPSRGFCCHCCWMGVPRPHHQGTSPIHRGLHGVHGLHSRYEVYQGRIKLHKVYYISRPRYFDRIRYGSGGSAPTVRVDLRVQSKMVLRFDVWRSEAIFLSPVMPIRNLRFKMFNPPGHVPVRESRGAPAVLSKCIKEDPRCLCCGPFSAQRPQRRCHLCLFQKTPMSVSEE